MTPLLRGRHRPVPTTGTTGDAALATAVRTASADVRTRRLAVAVVAGGRTTYAGLGADDSTAFEIGSATKGLTGLLLADAVERGEVTLDDRLGDHLDLGDGAMADVRLGAVAAHAAGVPRLPVDPRFLARGTWATLRGRNPYAGIDGPALLAAAARTPVAADPRPEYSNLGAALVGQALAARAGVPYGALLRDRVTGPLGMTRTTVPDGSDGGLVPGTSRSGRRQEPWVMDGFAPAGAVRSTAGDLARLVAAMLDGSVPGAAALAPRSDLTPDDRVGLFWLTRSGPSGGVVWHNGMTGGFASFVGVDRDAGRGVAVLSDVADPVDEVGRRLLAGTSGP